MPDTLPVMPSPWISLWHSIRLGWKAQPRLMALGLLTTFLAAVPDALIPLGLAWLASGAVDGSSRTILLASATLAGLACGTWLLGIVSARLNLRLTDRSALDVESHMADLYTSISTLEHHERSSYVGLLAPLREHASALSQLYQMLFNDIALLVRVLIVLSLLVAVGPELALLLLPAVLTIVVTSWRAGVEKRAEEAGTQDVRRARSLFLLATTPGPAKEVRIAQVQDVLADLSESSWRAAHRRTAVARTASASWTAGAYALFAITLVLAIAHVAGGAGSLPEVMVVVSAGTSLSQYLAEAVRQTHLFRIVWLDCARRLAWLEDFAGDNLPKAGTSGVAGIEPPPERIGDGLRLEAVGFSYPGQERAVLQQIDLHLPAGAVVAIVGENGAGKSTLVKLLCRFYEPTQGRITLDGTDLLQLDTRRWRSRTSGAFQDFVKFEYRLGEAVALGDLERSGDPARLERALAQAGADDLLARLPAGLDSQLGASWEHGIDLSHGQWQKIALARAFMRTRPLLTVLDEPTSGLDSQAEHQVFERYAQMARAGAAEGRITVLVSHRLSTVQMADLIVVIEGNRLVERGSHDELMAANGSYASLYRIQASAYRDAAPSPSAPQET